jgi:glucosamine--fructose-6-phosphate aminotransferase (isomerizing)
MAKILSFYNFAEKLSLARGLNPDEPPFLQKVTQTK